MFRHEVSLLAYSPLAFRGTHHGKYDAVDITASEEPTAWACFRFDAQTLGARRHTHCRAQIQPYF
jgi:hypothetical protein